MMKRIVLALLLLVGMGRAATLSGSLTYTFTTTTACSPSVTSNCATNFVIGYMLVAAFVPVTNVPLPSNPAGTMTIPIPPFPFNGVYGSSIQFAVAVAVKDVNGAAWTPPPFVPSTGASLLVAPTQPTQMLLTVAP